MTGDDVLDDGQPQAGAARRARLLGVRPIEAFGQARQVDRIDALAEVAHRDADVPEHVADNGQLSLQPEMVLKRAVVKARKGENLARLASRYGEPRSFGAVLEWQMQ